LTCYFASHRIHSVLVGAWLSLVERTVRDREVGGSNPLAPTNFLKRRLLYAAVAFFRRDLVILRTKFLLALTLFFAIGLLTDE
jgi:hypothetical protein